MRPRAESPEALAQLATGRTVAAVKKGGHLHTHNLKTKKW